MHALQRGLVIAAFALVSAAASAGPYRCVDGDGQVTFSDRATSTGCVALNGSSELNRRHESLTDLANAKALLLRVYAAQARACTDAVTQRGHRALVDDRNCAATRQREEIEDAIRQLGGMPDDIVTEAHLFAIRDVGQAHRTLGSVIELTTP